MDDDTPEAGEVSTNLEPTSLIIIPIPCAGGEESPSSRFYAHRKHKYGRRTSVGLVDASRER